MVCTTLQQRVDKSCVISKFEIENHTNMKSDARAEDSLSVVSKSPEEAHDTPSA